MMICELFAIDAPLMLFTKRPVIREADRILKRYGAMPPAMMIDLSVRGDCHCQNAFEKGKRGCRSVSNSNIKDSRHIVKGSQDHG
jgi:hypothetical protein